MTNTEVTPATRDRAALAADKAAGDAAMARLVEEYHSSPEQRIARDRAEKQRLESDPYTLDKSRREIEVLEGRIREAEARSISNPELAMTDAELVDAVLAGEPVPMPWSAGSTVDPQVPAGDFVGAVAALIEQGARPTLVKSFFEKGRGDHPGETREFEEWCAGEWERRLLADPELQRKFLARDPELMGQFAAYGVYARDPRRE
jgi:hypothetical protein